MKLQRVITAIDTHTAGGPTRIITSGIPALPGKSVEEKYGYFQSQYDFIRKLLLNEPRGHKDMYGAVLVEPTQPEADLGVFFMNTTGYLPSCVHSTLGVATALLETGALKPKSITGEIFVETPSGLISLLPTYRDDNVDSIRLKTRPAYIHSPEELISFKGQTVKAGIVFSGVFFLLVDAQNIGLDVIPEKIQEFVTLGRELLKSANLSLVVSHPENPSFCELALVLFYKQVSEQYFRDIVIGRSGGVDRSPCGAGTGALAAYEYKSGRLGLHDGITVQGITGGQFEGHIAQLTNVGVYPGLVPEISGCAFITGFHQFVLTSNDPLQEGFSLGVN
jgi:proline racemase